MCEDVFLRGKGAREDDAECEGRGQSAPHQAREAVQPRRRRPERLHLVPKARERRCERVGGRVGWAGRTGWAAAAGTVKFREWPKLKREGEGPWPRPWSDDCHRRHQQQAAAGGRRVSPLPAATAHRVNLPPAPVTSPFSRSSRSFSRNRSHFTSRRASGSSKRRSGRSETCGRSGGDPMRVPPGARQRCEVRERREKGGRVGAQVRRGERGRTRRVLPSTREDEGLELFHLRAHHWESLRGRHDGKGPCGDQKAQREREKGESRTDCRSSSAERDPKPSELSASACARRR